MIDNLTHSFCFQIENGIPIVEWRGEENDNELTHLANFLIEAKDYRDLRDYNR